MHHERLTGQRLCEFLQVQLAQRIDQIVLVTKGELDQANLFEIVVQAVSLRVEGDPPRGRDAPDERLQRGAVANINELLGLRCHGRYDLPINYERRSVVAEPL